MLVVSIIQDWYSQILAGTITFVNMHIDCEVPPTAIAKSELNPTNEDPDDS